MSQQKSIVLVQIAHESSADEIYTLLIAPDGSRCVEVFYSPNLPCSRSPVWGVTTRSRAEYIHPDKFNFVKVEGKTLAQWISEKLPD